jgi:hypothetical protein
MEELVRYQKINPIGFHSNVAARKWSYKAKLTDLCFLQAVTNPCFPCGLWNHSDLEIRLDFAT